MFKDVFTMNRIILALLMSDAIMSTGFGLIDPILALYYLENIDGSSIFAIGLAASLFMVTKSLVQIPMARFVDSHPDIDDMRWLIVGLMGISAVPVLYLLATSMVHIYLIQMVYGVVAGISYATWLGLWSLHLDPGKESFEWSVYSTVVGTGAAISAAVGAGIAELFGFGVVFVVVAALSVAGASTLLALTYKKGVFDHQHADGQP